MGSCISRPEECVGGRRQKPSGGDKKRRRRRVLIKKRTMKTIDEAGDGRDQLAVENPALQKGSIEEAWFETFSMEQSDSPDDLHSVREEISSLHGFDGEFKSCASSFKDANNGGIDPHQEGWKSEEQLIENPVNNQSNGSLSNSKDFLTRENISSLAIEKCNYKEGEGVLDSCGNILPNNCLPCIATTALTVEKRKSFTSTPPNSAKKAILKLSFKRKTREGHTTPTLFSSNSVLERPLAGSQIPFRPVEKKMSDCWSRIDPGTFRVRGENYFRDKKKEFASNNAAYYPIGVDVYLSEHKINHIARFVELPSANPSSKLPPLLVVNVQVPLYPAAIFQNATDGEGFSFVLYFRLSESYSKELRSNFIDSIRRLINDDVEKVKSFPVDTIVPFRERLKILGRVANLEDLPSSAAEKTLMHKYNEKPLLSRPQHEFYSGENYFEIDLDMHRFSYISRKGFETFLDRLKLCILDVGLTIQGNKSEELPEQILCCVRLNGIDYTHYHPLAAHWP
ncbi:uncharacterized protein A4U43_C03F10320 [Asparagus officinalis]|uniref:Protein ENHANCED DISEASE RESISTANCE 2 C-terminal domain-containing protein n=1 Tax=Asparagus officinalis TaxID=4686 RepID=A0A5P1F901_ASPOF|nr:uncharacterized protein LOC109833378 [Asparagus officinalis]XP_020256619.1 uncharacterized protein LOC109833378 [Asparagus officinalis]ONK74805.1 uncharacterized protein A4U43_C03F10320 [Asparagus officinalis]